MKKIKWLSLLMAILVILSSMLTSCEQHEDDDDDRDDSSSSSSSSSASSSSSSSSSSSTSSSSSSSSSSSASSSSSSSSSTSSSSISSSSTVDDTVSSMIPPDPPVHHFSSKDTILNNWSGQTLNVLVTRYESSPSAPWGQIELNPSSFGSGIGSAYDERQAVIKELYGVDVEWVPAQANQTIWGDLATAELSDNIHYELAIPRIHEVQSLVSSVYNMGESDYLDFTNDYYSIAAHEAFTVAGYTLFASGGYDFMEEQTTSLLLYNKETLYEKAPNVDLYSTVKDGDWTYDKLKALSVFFSDDMNDDGIYGDEDIYGLGIVDPTNLYYYFGVFEADVDPDTGMYRFALDLDLQKAKSAISVINEIKISNTWAHINWGTDRYDAFAEGRLLFLDACIQKTDEMTLNFSFGAVPFPKLNDEQDDYITSVDRTKSTLICIPRVTQDRQMSEYFLDVLSWTGNDFTVKAYYESIEAKMDIDTADEDMEILTDYIFGKVKYDVGYLTNGQTALCFDIKNRALDENLEMIIMEETPYLIPTVQGWNNAWAAYDKDM